MGKSVMCEVTLNSYGQRAKGTVVSDHEAASGALSFPKVDAEQELTLVQAFSL